MMVRWLSYVHLRLTLWFVLFRVRLGKRMVDVGYWLIRHSFDVAGVDIKRAIDTQPVQTVHFQEWTKKYTDVKQ